MRAGLRGGGGARGQHGGEGQGRHLVRGQVTIVSVSLLVQVRRENIDCGQETPGYLFAELRSPLAVITLKLSCTSPPLASDTAPM